MSDYKSKLLAAAECASAAVLDLVQAGREPDRSGPFGNVACGDTATSLADALRLTLDATDEEASQLHGALLRFLEDRT